MNFRPDQISSIAQIFVSTIPASSPIACTLANDRSVFTPELFFGQAIQSIPARLSLRASFANLLRSSFSFLTNSSAKSIALAEDGLRTMSVDSLSSCSNVGGGLRMIAVKPALMPSFFTRGVLECHIIFTYRKLTELHSP